MALHKHPPALQRLLKQQQTGIISSQERIANLTQQERLSRTPGNQQALQRLGQTRFPTPAVRPAVPATQAVPGVAPAQLATPAVPAPAPVQVSAPVSSPTPAPTPLPQPILTSEEQAKIDALREGGTLPLQKLSQPTIHGDTPIYGGIPIGAISEDNPYQNLMVDDLMTTSQAVDAIINPIASKYGFQQGWQDLMTPEERQMVIWAQEIIKNHPKNFRYAPPTDPTRDPLRRLEQTRFPNQVTLDPTNPVKLT